jgi:tryptophan synthase beta subunit
MTCSSIRRIRQLLLIRLFQQITSGSVVARPPLPKTLREFQSKFATEEACQQYLAACRWPDVFVMQTGSG